MRWGDWLLSHDRLVILGTLILAAAAIGQIWLTARTARRQLRAYLGLLSIDVDMPHLNDHRYVIPSPPPQGHVFEDFILTAVKNYGATPAFRVSVIVNWIPVNPFGARLPDGYEYPDLNTSPQGALFISRGIADPQKEHLGTITVDSLEAFRDAKSKGVSIYFYGHIDYQDVFKRNWRRDFCFVWEPWRPEGRQLVPYHEHNEEYRV